jgi:hypothetical protein
MGTSCWHLSVAIRPICGIIYQWHHDDTMTEDDVSTRVRHQPSPSQRPEVSLKCQAKNRIRDLLHRIISWPESGDSPGRTQRSKAKFCCYCLPRPSKTLASLSSLRSPGLRGRSGQVRGPPSSLSALSLRTEMMGGNPLSLAQPRWVILRDDVITWGSNPRHMGTWAIWTIRAAICHRPYELPILQPVM